MVVIWKLGVLSPAFISSTNLHHQQPLHPTRPFSSTRRHLSRHDIFVSFETANRPNHPITAYLMPLNSQKLDELVEQVHVRAQGSIIGMDAEWQPEFLRHEHNKVALLQLNLNNDCFLIRLKHIEGPMPSSLQRLLADASIPKVGLNIMNDVQRLYMDYGLETNGALDIREVAQGLGLVHCRRRALAWMAKTFLGVLMDKEQQLSDWQDKELTPEQIQYSAVDSWVASSIVDVLYKKYKNQVGQAKGVTEFCQRLSPRTPKKFKEAREKVPKTSSSSSSGNDFPSRKAKQMMMTMEEGGGEAAAATG